MLYSCILVLAAVTTQIDQISHDSLRLHLSVDNTGAPRLRTNPSDPLPDALEWRHDDNAEFLRAETDRVRTDGLRETARVEVFRGEPLFRVRRVLHNPTGSAVAVDTFPIWSDTWPMGGVTGLHGWRALTFAPVKRELGPDPVVWASHIHSSDEAGGGMNPYMVATGDSKPARLFFALEWCGGWEASFSKPAGDTLSFEFRLPPDETQLTLNPGETLEGPALWVFVSEGATDAEARADWMTARAKAARALYGGPEPWYPLTYNNWYTTRFDLDAPFLRRQVAAMAPYTFDAFIVDAGWYESVGKWTPHPVKFPDGEFEAILRDVRAQGVIPGVWTCPQLLTVAPDNFPPDVDEPRSFEKFMNAHALDLAAVDFSARFPEHAAMLCEKYGAGWWKYDQNFFQAQTRAGRVKNVIEFQEGLVAARKALPSLMIENCQSGGRMINELTLMATQSQWLRDGGGSGLAHARDNIGVALGSLDFVFPWAACRWTNNIDTLGEDLELLRYYCRSAMPGTWGIVADLDKITPAQREVILAEIKNYRRFNAFKEDYAYDIIPPKAASPCAGIVFHTVREREAAALLFRWGAEGAFDQRLDMARLDPDATYVVQDADSGASRAAAGRDLLEQGVTVSFDAARRSALVFVSRAPALDPERAAAYRDAVKSCLDNILEHGLDRYGPVHTPMWMSVIDVRSGEAPQQPDIYDSNIRTEDRQHRRNPGGCDLWDHQPALRTAYALSELTQDPKYADAADAFARSFMERAQLPKGLLAWGSHIYYDAYTDAPVVDPASGSVGPHEILVMLPQWERMWKVNPEAVRREIDMFWEWHVVDKKTGLHNRHDDKSPGCDFAFSGGEIACAQAFLYRKTRDPQYLERAKIIARYHWNARNPETNLAPDAPNLSDRYDGHHCFTTMPGPHAALLLKCFEYTGDTEFRDMALGHIKAYLKYGWDESASRWWGMLTLDGKPVPQEEKGAAYDAFKPTGYIDIWPTIMFSYEFPIAAAQTALYAHELTADPDALQTARNWARAIRAELPPKQGRRWAAEMRAAMPDLDVNTDTNAENYGRTISFFLRLHKMTQDPADLQTAIAIADAAVAKLYENGWFKGHPRKPLYETADGVGYLLYALMELAVYPKALPPNL